MSTQKSEIISNVTDFVSLKNYFVTVGTDLVASLYTGLINVAKLDLKVRLKNGFTVLIRNKLFHKETSYFLNNW